MEDIVIVGSSGFANEIKTLVKREGKYHFLGFVDNKAEDNSILGDDEFLMKYDKKINVVIAIADPKIRKRLFNKYKQNSNVFFPSVIDPTAIIFEENSLGIGNIICAGTIITVGTKIKDFNIINLSCTIGHEASLNGFVTLNPSANVSGNVTLGENVFIGTGAQILQGIDIGSGSVVGAGSVVISDIPNDCTAVGVPAKVIKDRRE